MIVDDMVEIDHSKRYAKASSLLRRTNQLTREHNKVIRYATDPGLKMQIQENYQEKSVKKILNHLNKKITGLKRLTKKS